MNRARHSQQPSRSSSRSPSRSRSRSRPGDVSENNDASDTPRMSIPPLTSLC